MSKQSSKMLVPKLRFPEFLDAEEWEKKALADIALFYKGKGISKSDIDLQGKTPCIRYGELYTTYGEVIREVFSKTNLPLSELFLSQKNDVLIPSSGETKLDIAKASCVLFDDVALGGDLNVLRPNPNENGIFLSYLLNGACKHEIAKKAQGDTVVHLYSSQLKLLDVMAPKEPEQQKIADCLSSLDELIAAEAQQLAALKTYKKGLMQQLFPAEGETVPKLRFPEFQDAGEWESVELGALCEICTGRKDANEGASDGAYPFFTCADQHGYSHTYSFNTEAILIAGNANVGQTKYYKGKFEAYQRTYVLTDFRGINVAYLYTILSAKLQASLLAQVQTSAMSYIRLPMLKDFKLTLPTHENEQQKIADCLLTIDNLIASQSQRLDALKLHKKGLMQQLFPSADEVQA